MTNIIKFFAKQKRRNHQSKYYSPTKNDTKPLTLGELLINAISKTGDNKNVIFPPSHLTTSFAICDSTASSVPVLK